MLTGRAISGLLGGFVILFSAAVGQAQPSQAGESPELARLLAELRDEQGIVPLEASQSPGGDASLIQLYDANHLDRTLYLYYWPKTSTAFFLQVEGTLQTGGEVHLWGASTELVLTPRAVTRLATPTPHTFRTSSMAAAAALDPSDPLACIAQALGVPQGQITFPNVLGALKGVCLAPSFTNLLLTTLACLSIPDPAGLTGCTAGISQIIACGVPNCPAICVQPPDPPTALAATVNGANVTLNWGAPSGSVTSYVLEVGSSPGAVDIGVFPLDSAATSLSVSAVPSGTYYVRVRGKNACGVGGPSNEVVVGVGATTVTVPANPLWTDTRILVSAGATISITATGQWGYAGVLCCGPDGDPTWPDPTDQFFVGANKGELIAYIGVDPTQGHLVSGNTFFPQSTGYFAIGSAASFVAPASGELWLGINDDARTLVVFDNPGSLTATITVR
jgi:hypothetical protein